MASVAMAPSVLETTKSVFKADKITAYTSQEIAAADTLKNW
jgi:hypothetical protein